MPEIKISYNEKLQTYVLRLDGKEIATGDISELASLADETQAKLVCSLYGIRVKNEKDPIKKPGKCDGSDCRKCGWNPEVAKARTEAIRARLDGKKSV